MLHLHFANRFEVHAEDLAERLAREAGTRAPLVADEVVVPSAAITRRLIVTLARRDGVCANVRFSYLAQWLWTQTRRLWPELPPGAPFAPDTLPWRVFAAFGDAGFTQAHRRLAAYLAQADEVMRLQLAQRVGALFEQYLDYRPEWPQAWMRGARAPIAAGDADAAADQAWQADLFARIAHEAGTDARHPGLDLLDGLQARGIRLAGSGALPASAHLVCLPALAPVHLALLRGLGRHVELHLYVLNPCREYWLDLVAPRSFAAFAARGASTHAEVGNRLLAGWGRQTREQLGLLLEAEGDGVDDDARYTPSGTATRLGRLQDAILDGVDLAPRSVPDAPDDRSLEVHVCHSLTRELEVLHDRLLDLVSRPGAPPPGDVVVVTPDLEAAAPFIDAVFGTVPAERRIPYAITGRKRAQANTPARALLEVLALLGSRFAVSDVFGLLEQPIVARRFGLAGDDLDQVRDWFVDAGIHWGLDGAHRARFDLPPRARHSFADGLDRLFLGYAGPSRLEAPFAGQLPAGEAEGADAQRLGSLWRAMDTLAGFHARTATPLSPAAWRELLGDMTERLLAPADDELDALRELRLGIDALAEQWVAAGFDQPLALETVREALAGQLDEAARGGVPTGLVTFASMSSLRGLSFRVVCAIGLNDGAYPTGSRPPEFDLMARAPRAGDRQRRLDERNVFLDLLLGARDVLHLSYTGRSVRDNSVLPPSVLIAELLDALVPAIDAADARARCVVEHPLQPFSPSAFEPDADPRLRSFAADYAQALRGAETSPPVQAAEALLDESADDNDVAVRPAASAFFARPIAPPSADWLELPIERLAAFLRNPSRFLLEQRLGLELRRPQDELEDDEPFLPERHAGAPLATLVVPALLEGASRTAARELARSAGLVPDGAFGERFLERELDDLVAFATAVRDCCAPAPLPPHPVRLPIVACGETWSLQANFGDLRAPGLLRHRFAPRGPRDYLAAWLPHLMLCAAPPAGADPVTTGISRDGPWSLTPCARPLDVLQGLVELFARGLREPLAFFPRASWAFVDSGDKITQAAAEFRPGRIRGASESEDDGVRQAWRGRPDPLADPATGFAELAHRIYDPLRACLQVPN